MERAFKEVVEAKRLLVLGTSLVVSPTNQLVKVEKEVGATVVIVNKEATEYDKYADLVLKESIGEALSKVV